MLRDRLTFFLLPVLFFVALVLLVFCWQDDPVKVEKKIEAQEIKKQPGKTGFRRLKLEDMPPEMQRTARAREVTRSMVKAEAFTEFHQWLHDYLHAPLNQRESMMQRGRQLAYHRPPVHAPALP